MLPESHPLQTSGSSSSGQTNPGSEIALLRKLRVWQPWNLISFCSKIKARIWSIFPGATQFPSREHTSSNDRGNPDTLLVFFLWKLSCRRTSLAQKCSICKRMVGFFRAKRTSWSINPEFGTSWLLRLQRSAIFHLLRVSSQLHKIKHHGDWPSSDHWSMRSACPSLGLGTQTLIQGQDHNEGVFEHKQRSLKFKSRSLKYVSD